MQFSHDPTMLAEFPQLAVATLTLDGATDTADVLATGAPFLERASARLAKRPESEFAEIAASKVDILQGYLQVQPPSVP